MTTLLFLALSFLLGVAVGALAYRNNAKKLQDAEVKVREAAKIIK
jgi:uncharacterized membrane protein YgdD (TMEM256/DUF423 family)